MVPDAVVLIPLSLNWRPAGEGVGVGLGVAAAALGEGDADPVPPEPPHAQAIVARASIAINLFMPALSGQLCSKRYQCRLLDSVGRSILPTPQCLLTRAANRAGRLGARPGSRARAAAEPGPQRPGR